MGAGPLANGAAVSYIWVRYRLPLAMAAALVTVADATAALRAAGHTVTRTTKRDAARRYGCQTCLYVVDGRGVNVGRLRQLAAELAAVAPEAPEAAIDVRAIARAAGRAYEAACLARYADASDPEAQYVSAMEGQRAARAARIAATLAHANGADADGVRVAAADAVAQLAAFDAAFASR